MASKEPILNLTYSELLMTTEVILRHSQRLQQGETRLDIVLLLPMTAHCACVFVRSPKREFTTNIAEYT